MAGLDDFGGGGSGGGGGGRGGAGAAGHGDDAHVARKSHFGAERRADRFRQETRLGHHRPVAVLFFLNKYFENKMWKFSAAIEPVLLSLIEFSLIYGISNLQHWVPLTGFT